MSRDQSFLASLLARRVPQILGLYVAGTWMTIEIGDWVSAQLGLPEHLTLVAFTFLAVMLPSVAVVAWFHGAPGKDQWVTLEKFLIPLNGVLAIAVAGMVVDSQSPLAPESAQSAATPGSGVEQRVIVDETGAEQVFQVATEGFDQRVYGFFWSGGDEQDWQGYAVPWLLAQDLSRDPRISFRSPYELGIRSELERAGFARGVGEPLALDLSIAREGSARWVVVGEYRREADGFHLRTRLIDVASGAEEASFEAASDDLVKAVEAISDQLGEAIIGDGERSGADFADLELAESTSASPEALRAFIEGLNAWWFDNDFEASLARLNDAVTLDPTFALAHDWRHQFLRATGDITGATEAIKAALRFDYKLESQTRFKLKANQYALAGQTERAVRVLEVWSEVHPNSFDVFRLLATNYTFVGRLDDARAALVEANRINPRAAEVFRELANIERMSGAPQAAAELLERYLEEEPADADAMITLASSLLQAGEFERARAVYEDASFIASKDFESGQGIVAAFAREGRFDEAHARLNAMASVHSGAAEQLGIGVQRAQLLKAQGRINEAMSLLDSIDEAARQVMPPLARVFTLAGLRASLFADLGRFKDALLEIDDMQSHVQPPIDALLDVSRLTVYGQAQDIDGLRLTLDRFTETARQYSFPIAEPFQLLARARLALLEGDPQSAVSLYGEGIEGVRQTALGLDMGLMDSLTVHLAVAEVAAGSEQQARNRLEAHLTMSPADGLAMLVLAELLLDQEQAEAARLHLNRVSRQWSRADEQLVHLERLNRLRGAVEEGAVTN